MNDRIAAARPGLPAGWPSLAWMTALVAASITFTLGFACATPLAAFAVVAALTLPRREALGLMLAVWIANQAAGFLILGYPTTANAYGWGLAIGLSGVLAMEAARLIVRSLAGANGAVRIVTAFAAAFLTFEVALYAASLAGLGGLDAYSAAIIGRILAINACAAAGLFALHAVVLPLVPARLGKTAAA